MGQPAGLGHRSDPASGDQEAPEAQEGAGRQGPPRRLLRRRGRVRRHAGLLAGGSSSGLDHRRSGDHRGVRLDGSAAPRLPRADRQLPQHHRDAFGRGRGQVMSMLDKLDHRRQLDHRDSSTTGSSTGADGLPVRPPHRRRRRERRPGPGRDRPGVLGERGDGGRDGHRADLPVADDPRRPRLPGRHPRPAAAQADRPLLLRAGPSRRPRLPARGDERGRRLLPQRRLPVRGRHRPPARPVRHRAGVRRCRRRPPGRRVRPGVRAPRRHRRRRTRFDAQPRHQRLRRGTDGPARSSCGTPACPTGPRWRS